MDAIESMPQEENITPEIRQWLADVAALHEDQVPIHGRLFAQWLHFVFPHECPYPHMGGLLPKTLEQWREQVGVEAESVSEDELRMHVAAGYYNRATSPDAGK